MFLSCGRTTGKLKDGFSSTLIPSLHPKKCSTMDLFIRLFLGHVLSQEAIVVAYHIGINCNADLLGFAHHLKILLDKLSIALDDWLHCTTIPYNFYDDITNES